MKTLVRRLFVLAMILGASQVCWALDHITVESKTVPAGATGVTIAIRMSNSEDPSCPHVDRGDIDCSGFDDVLDVSLMIDVLYAGGSICDPCECDPYPTSCP